MGTLRSLVSWASSWWLEACRESLLERLVFSPVPCMHLGRGSDDAARSKAMLRPAAAKDSRHSTGADLLDITIASVFLHELMRDCRMFRSVFREP